MSVINLLRWQQVVKRISKKYIKGERDLGQAYDSAKAQGADVAFYCKLKRTKEAFADTAIDEELSEMSPEVLKKCKFEIGKLQTRLSRLETKIKKLI